MDNYPHQSNFYIWSCNFWSRETQRLVYWACWRSNISFLSFPEYLIQWEHSLHELFLWYHPFWASILCFHLWCLSLIKSSFNHQLSFQPWIFLKIVFRWDLLIACPCSQWLPPFFLIPFSFFYYLIFLIFVLYKYTKPFFS